MLKFLSTYYLEADKVLITENPVSDDDDVNAIWMMYGYYIHES